MQFPDYRPRRLRKSDELRRLVRETTLTVDDLVAPLFVCPGRQVRNPISSMPGHAQLSCDLLVEEVRRLKELGILAVLLFGIPEKRTNRQQAPSPRTGSSSSP